MTKVDKEGNALVSFEGVEYVFRHPKGRDVVGLQNAFKEGMGSYELLAHALALLCISQDLSVEDVLDKSAEFMLEVGAEVSKCFPVLGGGIQ